MSESRPTSALSSAARPLTVSEAARRITRLLEEQIGQVWLTGEVSNVRIPASGHCYFLLKDAGAAINAVCFRSALARQPLAPREGMELEVRGRVTAYAPRSEYQVIVETIREAGAGALMRRFLELKEKLTAEGLFDRERKRPIPRLPRRIGIVTSSTGAALRDMLNVLGRRVRGMEIWLAPAAVQGAAAPCEIAAAIARLEHHGRAEVIIAGRGGGSIEDLWAFNEEAVVRAIAACSIPVISAVGHETDTTLADYAADLRAPTPSAAAELVSEHHGELADRLDGLQRRLNRAMGQALGERRARLERCRASWGLRSPRERLLGGAQRCDELRGRLETAAQRVVRGRNNELAGLRERLTRASPAVRLKRSRERLDQLRRRLTASGPRRIGADCQNGRRIAAQTSQRLELTVRHRLRTARARLDAASARLGALNPEAVLQRGYSIVTQGKRERVVTGPGQARPGAVVRIRGAGGVWRAAALDDQPDLFENMDVPSTPGDGRGGA